MARALLIATDTGGDTIDDGDFFMVAGNQLNAAEPAEADHAITAYVPGHVCKFGVNSDDPSAVNPTFTFRINSADASQVLAPTVEGWNQQDGADILEQDDLWNVGSTGGTGGLTVFGARVIFEADEGHQTYFYGMVRRLIISTTSQYIAPTGIGVYASPFPAEANAAIKISQDGTIANLHIRLYRNDQTSGVSAFHLLINGVAGNSVIFVPAGAIGNFVDAVNTDPISAGDTVSVRINLGTGSELVGIEFLGVTFAADNDDTADVFGEFNTTTAVTDVRYMPIGGFTRGDPPLVEAFTRLRTGFPATLSKLRVRVRVQGADGNGLVTIPAGATGWFQDESGSDAVGEDDDINLSITGGAGGLEFFRISTYGIAIRDDGGGTPCGQGGGPTEPHETPDFPLAEAEIPQRELVLERIANQRWLIRSAHLRQWGEIGVDDLRLTIKRGIGTTDTEPAIWVRANRDNKGFGKWTKRGLGLIGDRTMVLGFGGFGCARDWQFEIATSDDCEIELRKAEILTTPLGH